MLTKILVIVIVAAIATQQWLSAPLALSPLCVLFSISCPAYTDAHIQGLALLPWETPFRSLVLSQINRGLSSSFQVSVNFRGQTVVNLAVGSRWSPASAVGQSVHPDHTLMQVWSAAKTPEAIAFLLLLDRGLIANFNDPVSKYWPEYAQHGKQHTTLADFLRHQSPTPWTDPALSFEELLDADAVARRYEQQSAVSGGNVERRRIYHACNRGLLLSEIVRRVDPGKRSLGEFIQEELAMQTSGEYITGFNSLKRSRQTVHEISERFERNFIDYRLRSIGRIMTGIRLDAVDSRMISGVLYDKQSVQNNATALGSIGKPNIVENFEKDEYHKLELTSCNVLSTAKSLANIMAILANDGQVNGKQIVSKEVIQKHAFNEIETAYDEFITTNTSFSSSGVASFVRCGEHSEKGLLSYGWAGNGGQLAIALPSLQLSLGFATPLMELTLDGHRACEFWRLAIEVAENLSQKN